MPSKQSVEIGSVVTCAKTTKKIHIHRNMLLLFALLHCRIATAFQFMIHVARIDFILQPSMKRLNEMIYFEKL